MIRIIILNVTITITKYCCHHLLSKLPSTIITITKAVTIATITTITITTTTVTIATINYLLSP